MTLHNELVEEMIGRWMGGRAVRGMRESEMIYVDVAMAWGNAMAEWMIACERYKVRV